MVHAMGATHPAASAPARISAATIPSKTLEQADCHYITSVEHEVTSTKSTLLDNSDLATQNAATHELLLHLCNLTRESGLIMREQLHLQAAGLGYPPTNRYVAMTPTITQGFIPGSTCRSLGIGINKEFTGITGNANRHESDSGQDIAMKDGTDATTIPDDISHAGRVSQDGSTAEAVTAPMSIASFEVSDPQGNNNKKLSIGNATKLATPGHNTEPEPASAPARISILSYPTATTRVPPPPPPPSQIDTRGDQLVQNGNNVGPASVPTTLAINAALRAASPPLLQQPQEAPMHGEQDMLAPGPHWRQPGPYPSHASYAYRPSMYAPARYMCANPPPLGSQPPPTPISPYYTQPVRSMPHGFVPTYGEVCPPRGFTPMVQPSNMPQPHHLQHIRPGWTPAPQYNYQDHQAGHTGPQQQSPPVDYRGPPPTQPPHAGQEAIQNAQAVQVSVQQPTFRPSPLEHWR